MKDEIFGKKLLERFICNDEIYLSLGEERPYRHINSSKVRKDFFDNEKAIYTDVFADNDRFAKFMDAVFYDKKFKVKVHSFKLFKDHNLNTIALNYLFDPDTNPLGYHRIVLARQYGKEYFFPATLMIVGQ